MTLTINKLIFRRILFHTRSEISSWFMNDDAMKFVIYGDTAEFLEEVKKV